MHVHAELLGSLYSGFVKYLSGTLINLCLEFYKMLDIPRVATDLSDKKLLQNKVEIHRNHP